MNLKKNLFSYLCIGIIVIIGFSLRYFKNFYDGYWADEILTLEISNPKLNYEQFFKAWKDLDGSPIFYFYFLRVFFQLFGFTAENGRVFSIIFSTLAIFFSFFFFRVKFSSKISIVGCLLIALNIFLIWQSKDTRIQSSVLFFSLINLIYFYHYLKTKSSCALIYLNFLNFLLLSYYPFTITIFISQFIYLIIIEKKLAKIIIFFTLAALLYLIVNYYYIILSLARGHGHIGILNIKFFFNYFFSSFFGSIYLGGFYFFLFFLSIITILKNKISKNNILLFHLILIFFTYFFLIFYSIFKTEIAVPRYFIFLIPSIIFIILQLFANDNYRMYLYLFIFLTFLNTIILFPKSSIPKPPMKNLLDNMPLTDSNIILHNDEYYRIYYNNYRKFTDNYKVISEYEANLYKKIWFICLNNPRSIVGDLILPEENKCKFELNNFKEIKKIYITDFKIVLFEKND